MNLPELWKDLWQNQRALMSSGIVFVALLVVLSALSLFDSQQILGISRWIKPSKFASSIAIYFFTLAVYLNFLRGFDKSKKVIAWGVVVLLTGEMVLILMQSIRGTTSHFNSSSAFDATVFSLMGLMIVVNTLLIVYLTVLYFRAEVDLPEALIWGMRLGLILFLLASAQGGYMSAQTGHAVGVPDGGAGLPFVNWSTEGGDLRAAHFVGMHALQAIPLFAAMLIFLQKRFSAIRATALTIIFALLYFAAFSIVFTQALRGKPLLGKEIIVEKSNP
jgi:hypothetical protein